MTLERVVDVFESMCRQWLAHVETTVENRPLRARQARDWLFGAERFLGELGIAAQPYALRERAHHVFVVTDARLRTLAEEGQAAA